MPRIVTLLLLLSACDYEAYDQDPLTASGTGDCASGEWWSGEDDGQMSPGSDCLACHDGDTAPFFSVAGTVMGGSTDGTGCVGVHGVEVRVTDATGRKHLMITNRTGNFFTAEQVPTPYTVELEYKARRVEMPEDQTDGGCASCHTADGVGGASGRIVAP